MKPKIIFYLAFTLIGGLWILVITNGRFTNWLLERRQNPNIPDVIRTSDAAGPAAKKLKIPWTDSKVVLYRASGEVVQLDAKSAVYAVWSTKPSTNQHKPFDVPVTAFIDPATKKTWVGWVAAGEIETNEYENADNTVSTNYLVYTDLFIETGSEIIRGDNVIWDGTFDWDESMIKRTLPSGGLAAVIEGIETNAGSAWPFPHIHGETRFEDYFPEGFFSSGNLGSQSIPIQRIKISNGKLRLYIDSLKYKTTAGIWLDLNTFEVRRTIEYRPVHFDLETFCWGIVPALIAIIIIFKTLLLALKVRTVAHGITSGIVLIFVIWSLFVLFQIYLLGAWPTHFPFFHPVFALGDWARYLPVAGIGVATMITVGQVLLVRSDKQK
jgi:hypothetical protein